MISAAQTFKIQNLDDLELARQQVAAIRLMRANLMAAFMGTPENPGALRLQNDAKKKLTELLQSADMPFEAAESLFRAEAARYMTDNDTVCQGISRRKSHTFDVVSAAEVPKEYLTPDVDKIGALVAKVGKDAERLVPGIRVNERWIYSFKA